MSSIGSPSLMLDPFLLENFGLCGVITDTYAQQTVLSIYGLMLDGLCSGVQERWAPSFTLPINTWAGISLPSTSWTGITLPTTTWVLT